MKISIIKSEDFNTFAMCLLIRFEVFTQEQNVDVNQDIDSFESSSMHFLLCVDSIPAATGRFRKSGEWIKFERIATRKHFRSQGLARKLMQYMEEEASRAYPKIPLKMHAQVHAIPFYEKLEWKAEGEVFLDEGIEHKVMVKQV